MRRRSQSLDAQQLGRVDQFAIRSLYSVRCTRRRRREPLSRASPRNAASIRKFDSFPLTEEL